MNLQLICPDNGNFIIYENLKFQIVSCFEGKIKKPNIRSIRMTYSCKICRILSIANEIIRNSMQWKHLWKRIIRIIRLLIDKLNIEPKLRSINKNLVLHYYSRELSIEYKYNDVFVVTFTHLRLHPLRERKGLRFSIHFNSNKWSANKTVSFHWHIYSGIKWIIARKIVTNIQRNREKSGFRDRFGHHYH